MTKQERIDLCRQTLALSALGISPTDAENLRGLSRRYHKSLENDCNLDDGKQEQRAAYQERCEQRARKMMPEGVCLYIQGGGRGASFYVCGPDVARPLEQHYSDGIAVY